MDSEGSEDIFLPPSPRFYRSYLDLASDETPPDIDPEALLLLKDRGFSKFIIENEDPVTAVKMIAYTMSHSLLKPQRLLVDDDDYYVAIDLFTNTYYICYRNLLMIDVDRYKQDVGTDTLEDLKLKLNKHPEFFFRIYSSRNGYHVFVLNRKMDYKSDESIRLMKDLGSDFYYIVYTYLRGWSVRLNKKKGEENRDDLYEWIGDVVCGQFFPSNFVAKDEQPIISPANENAVKIKFEDIVPDQRLEDLVELHISLSDVFKDVGLCSMPAPN
jgi:hypothetical protein